MEFLWSLRGRGLLVIQRYFLLALLSAIGLLLFGVFLFASELNAQSVCRMTWRQTPRIAPAHATLSCEIAATRRLVVTRRSGAERTFRRERFERLRYDYAAYSEALNRFARLRRRCRRIDLNTFNTQRFTPSFGCFSGGQAPTPTPTPVPFRPPEELELSRSAVNFGAVGLHEHRTASVIVRSADTNKRVQSLVYQGQSGITLLSFDEVTRHGGVPCRGSVYPFCSLMLKLDASSVGAIAGEVQLMVRGDSGNELHVLPVQALVQSEHTRHLDRYSKVDVKTLASEADLSLRAYATQMFDAIRPVVWTDQDRVLFDDYQATGPSVWKSNWANSAFDFSGVAWDVHTAGTAITRCHIVFAAHYQRNSFQPIRFHRKNGERLRTEVTRIRKIEGTDIGVGRLDPCLPPDWTIYRVLALPTLAFGQSDPAFKELPVIATHHQRYISLWEVSNLVGSLWYTTRSPRYPHMYRDAIVGDSGNPLFAVVDGELILMMTFSANGVGPAYTSAPIDNLLTEAINNLGWD